MASRIAVQVVGATGDRGGGHGSLLGDAFLVRHHREVAPRRSLPHPEIASDHRPCIPIGRSRARLRATRSMRSSARAPCRAWASAGRERTLWALVRPGPSAQEYPWTSRSLPTSRRRSTSSTRSSNARSSRWRRPTTTSGSSTTGGSARAPTSRTAGCPGASGRSCSARCAAAPTRPGGCATRCPAEYGGRDASQPRDGRHPRAPRRQGPRPAQRSAERELDHRQLPDRAR